MQLTNSTAVMNEEIRDRRNTIQKQTKIKERKIRVIMELNGCFMWFEIRS